MPVGDDQHLFQYAIIRRDLEMPPGKLAAQSGHAFTDALANAELISPEVVKCYRQPDKGGSKVVLKAKRVRQLLKAYIDAKNAGIPCALIVDQHHILLPKFTGEPIITAIGIGPCTKEQARFITKNFNCV
jgi:PTH2 family peptidyl-tRNA hydrolase